MRRALTKTDAVPSTDIVTTCTYDAHAEWPNDYATLNNRLMEHETVQGSTTPERAWYACNRGGNVKRMVKRWPGGAGGADPNTYDVTDMQYDLNQDLRLIRKSEWPLSGEPNEMVVTKCRQSVFYTAFGEILDPNGSPKSGSAGILPAGHPRFAYAGGAGYESPTTGNTPGPEGGVTLTGPNPNLPPITLQHVGFRWYQPDSGRFVQRDPIGIAGGLCVFTYCRSRPTGAVDPLGLDIWRWNRGWHQGVTIGPLPRGAGYRKLDFGPKRGKSALGGGAIWDSGDVGIETEKDRPCGVPYRNTSPEQDLEALELARALALHTPDYCVFEYNCFSFVNAIIRVTSPPAPLPPNWEPPPITDRPYGPRLN